ncbi:Glutathione-dependent formaldehyde-activating enzyme [Microbulbifer aggregans]|uniref:Glutathione-dependent formaldehyde-activating enzyme n=1 Tax=Microbulbifer aggregans TaxID=1769779 RepID=A0A1C9W7G3_9GAMM|nr:GFA family protein [Microbulbifer aggregans]AOS97092.1 Glutathione-dependent formaldehyde-activating enzyme [Microbulbifer aggregans]
MSQSDWPLRGGCHCGAVRFRATMMTNAGQAPVAHECNCSMCQMVGFQHLIVAAENFELLQGSDALSCYTFNTGVAKHYFCRHCGVKSYYVPRSNPDGYSINLRCLDEIPEGTRIEPFDGQHWEVNASALAHLSKVEKNHD